ncbi:MAG: adenylate/guanylate cyclase domain-containing protein [Thiobacillaceae bacterium]
MKRPKKILWGQWALSGALIALLALQAGEGIRLPYLDKLEAALYDSWLRANAPDGVDDRIAILDIDEKSLKEVGRWPWGRDKMATLVDRLFNDYGVAGLGFDVVFAEPDVSSGIAALDKLARGPLSSEGQFLAAYEQLRPRLDHDGLFAQSLKDKAVSLGYYFIPKDLPPETTGVLPAPDFSDARKLPYTPDLAAGYGTNLAKLEQAAPVAGYFNSFPDADGTARRWSLTQQYQGAAYGALSVETLRAAFGGDPLVAGEDKVSLLGVPYRQPWLEVGGLKVPVDANGRIFIPYRAGTPFPYFSAADVLAGRVSAKQLENRIMLVGSTAPGLADLRVTPFYNIYPGVAIHAHLMAGMLDGTIRVTPPWAKTAELVAIIGLGVLMVLGMALFGPLGDLLLALGLGGGLLVAYGLAWNHHWVLPLAAPLVTVIGLFLLNTAYGFFVEARSKRQITKLFGQYVPPELADKMSQDPTNYSMEGQSREMTVLFSDIRGFTNFSESLPPTELAEVLNAYLSRMTAIVQQHRGTIDKYIGDAVMAFWNAPVETPNHAELAVQAGLEMQAALPGLNKEFAARGWPEVKIGVGVNTGRMSVGNMGSEFRLSYTVMGDAVNLGSRLEGITKQYGVGILATETTVAADHVHQFMKIDVVRVKGKEKPVTIYQPLGRKGELSEDASKMAQLFEAAFERYQKQDWTGAETLLHELAAIVPCGLCETYLDRIAHFRENPPAQDWDGVFVYTTK